MRKYIAGVGFVLWFLGMFAMGASAEDFSADVISRSGNETMQGKMYVSGQNVRMEFPQAVTIARMDKKVVWVLMPTEHMYMEQEINLKDMASATTDKSKEIERKSLGNDTVNGKTVEKFQVKYDYDGKELSIYEWKDASIVMPVKTAAIDGSWSMEYSNINTGSQDASLFELPSGYQKFSMSSFASAMQQ